MNSFERGPSPEQPNEETFESKEEKEVLEQNLDLEVAINEEKGILERFRGRAKVVSKVMMLVSALSVGSGIAKEAYAQETQSTARVEQVEQEKEEKQKIEINEANLTASSEWSTGIIDSAKRDMDKIKTAEDAEWLVRGHLNPFVSEYYMPTHGELKEGPYGIKTRGYTEDDSKYLLQNAEEMKEILEELNDKSSIGSFGNRMDQIRDMIKKLERQVSHAGQKPEEALERLEKILQQR